MSTIKVVTPPKAKKKGKKSVGSKEKAKAILEKVTGPKTKPEGAKTPAGDK